MYDALFEDENDIFGGTPRSKFMDIIYNANQNLAILELERLMQRQAALELMLDEVHGEALEQKIKAVEFERADEITNLCKSLYIESVGNILSANE